MATPLRGLAAETGTQRVPDHAGYQNIVQNIIKGTPSVWNVLMGIYNESAPATPRQRTSRTSSSTSTFYRDIHFNTLPISMTSRPSTLLCRHGSQLMCGGLLTGVISLGEAPKTVRQYLHDFLEVRLNTAVGGEVPESTPSQLAETCTLRQWFLET